jgi:hypothetical protein
VAGPARALHDRLNVVEGLGASGAPWSIHARNAAICQHQQVAAHRHHRRNPAIIRNSLSPIAGVIAVP